MTKYNFGEVPGVPVGTTFRNRKEAKDAGIHQVTQQGISGNRSTGANSVVISGGYADDEDHGDWIIYTGSGGRDRSTGRQIADQELGNNDNEALAFSEENALPVRILRGSKGDPAYSPSEGYRYDGLFKVFTHWSEIGRDGYRIWRFRLDRLSGDEAAPWDVPLGLRSPAETSVPEEELKAPEGSETTSRSEGVVQRIVRNTRVSDFVKLAHDHECQICGISMPLPVGRYAEGAHIRALGEPHNGPDSPDNVLCLCPNHHVLMDKGAIYVDDDFQVRDFEGIPIGSLTQVADHAIEIDHFRYHRRAFGYESIVVGAVIVDKLSAPSRVLATRRTGDSEFGGRWEFPRGKVETGETAESAVHREVMEELGVALRIGSEVTSTVGGWAIPPESRLRLFLAEIEAGSPRHGDFDNDVMWATPDELLRLEWLPADAAALEAVSEALSGK